LPSDNVKSSSVSLAYFCFNFPFTAFHLPLTCNFVAITKGLRESACDWLSPVSIFSLTRIGTVRTKQTGRQLWREFREKDRKFVSGKGKIHDEYQSTCYSHNR